MKLILHLLLISAVLLYTKAQRCIAECDGCERKAVGETWQGHGEGCYQVTCKKEGNGIYSKNKTECDFPIPGPGCRPVLVAVNPEAPYPSCCPKVECRVEFTVCPDECPGCDKKADGDTWEGYREKGCYQVTCLKRRGLTSWSGKGCSFDVDPDCFALEGDADAPFPRCCPQIACA